MKKIFISLILFLAGGIAFGQHLEIIPNGGWQFPAGVDAYYGNDVARFRIKGAGNYGLGLHFVLPHRYITISASFSSMNSNLTYETSRNPETTFSDARQEYWMFGALKEVSAGPVSPFGGVILGWTALFPDDPEYKNISKFSVGLEGGVKYFFSDKVGIMIHGRLLFPIQWAGGGFYLGTGGSGVSFGTGTSIIQGDIGGGLVFKLGNN